MTLATYPVHVNGLIKRGLWVSIQHCGHHHKSLQEINTSVNTIQNVATSVYMTQILYTPVYCERIEHDFDMEQTDSL